MAKFSRKARVLSALGAGVPVVLFFVARSVASWRPHLIGVQPAHVNAVGFDPRFLDLSPDNKWLASSGDVRSLSNGEFDQGFLLWNSDTSSKRLLDGDQIEFSSNSHLIAVETNRSDDDGGISLNVQSVQGVFLWKCRLFEDEELVGFSGKEVQTKTKHSRRFYDAKTGELLRTLPAETSPWKARIPTIGGFPEDASEISYFPHGATKPKYSFKTANEYDTWKLSPDKSLIWVWFNLLHRFDVRDAQTGKRLWFSAPKDTGFYTFSCEPLWEDGGKTLVTIEHDALIVRDGRTGKVLLWHKNNLPAPLRGWTFTKNRDAVYLMDAKGEIFRQRLR